MVVEPPLSVSTLSTVELQKDIGRGSGSLNRRVIEGHMVFVILMQIQVEKKLSRYNPWIYLLLLIIMIDKKGTGLEFSAA